jgi:hypothetical protein
MPNFQFVMFNADYYVTSILIRHKGGDFYVGKFHPIFNY